MQSKNKANIQKGDDGVETPAKPMPVEVLEDPKIAKKVLQVGVARSVGVGNASKGGEKTIGVGRAINSSPSGKSEEEVPLQKSSEKVGASLVANTTQSLVERVFGEEDAQSKAGPTTLSRTSAVRQQDATPGAFAHGAIADAPPTSGRQQDELPSPTPNDPIERMEAGASIHPDTGGLAVAQPVDEAGDQQATNRVEATEYVPLSAEETKAREWARKKSVAAKLGGLLLIIAAFVIWIVWMVGVFDEDDTGDINANLANKTTAAPSQPPTKEPLLIELPPFTTDAIEEDPSSPQAKAYQWLKNDAMLSTANESQLLQRYSLVTFYYATNGDDWFINDGWLEDTLHECEWQSKLPEALVNNTNGPCDEDGNYLSLIMTANGLVATEIPLEVTLLSSLEYLDIATNEVEGTIPIELALMTTLKDLSIDNNALTGSVPSELMQLTNLEILQVQDNPLTGTFPSQLGLMSNLAEFLWFDTLAGGTMPTQIGLMTSVRSFYVFGNPITGTIPSQVGRLTNMTNFQWSWTSVSGTIPTQVGFLTKVKRLQLESQMLSGTIPTEFGLMTSLSSNVEIHSNLFTGTIPTEIGGLTSMREFYAFGNTLTGALPSELGLIPALASVDVEVNQLNSTVPTELGNCPLFWNLWLRGNDFTGTIPSELGLLSKMERFYIDTNQLSSTIPVELCAGMDKVRIFSVGMNQLTGTIPADCFVNKSGLGEFYVNGNNGIGGKIPSEIGLATSLWSLSFSNTSMTGQLPPEMSNLASLEALDVEATDLSGEIPEDLCGVPTLNFDCSGALCGCDCLCNSTLDAPA